MSKKSKKKNEQQKMEENKEQQLEQEVEMKEDGQEVLEKEEVEEVNELEKLQGEVQEAKDKYLRLYSEFENFRRRNAKERLELIGSANESLIQKLLPVLDDFERADGAFSETGEIKTFKEGYDLIYNKLKNVTDQSGLKIMELKPGDDFNPEIHDAVAHIPAPEDKLKGKVVDVLEKGYLLNEKVIRFAKVVTGS